MPRKKITPKIITHTPNHSISMYDHPKEIIEYIESKNIAINYAYIYHNKDTKENGELKEPHYHLLIHFPFRISGEAVKQLYTKKCKQNVFIEDIKNKRLCFEYLIHANNPEKAQYEWENIITNSYRWWYKASWEIAKNDKENTALNIISDILCQELNIFQMVQKYGREYVIYRKMYAECAKDIQAEIEEIKPKYTETKETIDYFQESFIKD